MMERILNNDLAVKILSVLLGLLLWTVVIRDYNAPETRTLSIPLKVIPHPTFAVYEGPPEGLTVEIQVSDRKLVVGSVRPEQFTAILDYSQVKEPGKPTPLDVKVEGPKNVSFFVISPKQLTVTLIEQATKLVPLTVDPESGVVNVDDREFRYTIHSSIDKVSLAGRKDFLQYVKNARLEVPREQLAPPKKEGVIDLTPVRLPARVVPLSETGEQVANLPAQTAEVEITWEELAPGKAYSLKPTVSGSPAAGYEVTGVRVEPATVTLRPNNLGGKLPTLEALDLSLVDVTGQSKSFTTTARVVAPPGTTASPEEVSVMVSIGEVRVERVFGAMPIQAKGAPAEGVVLIEPAAVEVRLKGPSSVLAGVGPQSLSVTVDVRGLPVGVHNLPLQLGGVPAGVDLSLNPAVVKVTISNQ
jgi:YbbR domain-containing protein